MGYVVCRLNGNDGMHIVSKCGYYNNNCSCGNLADTAGHYRSKKEAQKAADDLNAEEAWALHDSMQPENCDHDWESMPSSFTHENGFSNYSVCKTCGIRSDSYGHGDFDAQNIAEEQA